MTNRMRLLIGYDGSTWADAAIKHLRAAGLPKEVEALVVCVSEAPIVPPLASHEIIERAVVSERVVSIVKPANTHVSETLAHATDLATTASLRLKKTFPSWRVYAETAQGRPAKELIKKAREWNSDLIVVGCQGRSAIGRFILGSVSLQVVLGAPCSVRIGRGPTLDTINGPRRVVVGLDALANSDLALHHVLKRVWTRETELRIIAVHDGRSLNRVSNMKFSSETSRGMFRLVTTEDLKVFAEMRRGDPATTLMAEANEWNADSIFVGADDFQDIDPDSNSSVATHLATESGCSIEIVR